MSVQFKYSKAVLLETSKTSKLFSEQEKLFKIVLLETSKFSKLVELQEKLEFYMSEVDLLVEESPTMSAGSGSVAGIGIGPDGEPGIQRRKRKTKMLTRKYIEVNGKRKAFSREYTI